MSDKLRRYETEHLRVTWSARRCIHFEACVRGLLPVFDPAQKPWIQPESGDTEDVVDVVLRCPTGALHFERLDGGPAEAVPGHNEVHVTQDGPLYVRGDITLRTPDGEELLRDTRVALCRCGQSKNKPFCDGTHARVGFRDSGASAAPRLEAGDGAGGIEITLLANGPYQLRGPIRLRAAGGSAEFTGVACKLCRCGHSGSKPFCDGSHRREGWQENPDTA